MGGTVVKSCLNYQGNKYKLLKEQRFHEYLPKINHDNPYCELFCGSAVLFFNIDAPFAFLNDINEDLQTFWKVVHYQYDAFESLLQDVWPGFTLDLSKGDVERAVQFYISNLLSSFITKPLKIQKNLEFWRAKLDAARLWIDSRPFDAEMDYLTKLYTNHLEDRPCRVVFYEDPPYYNMESVYHKMRSDQYSQTIPPFDHHLLAEKNHQARDEGHFILLSYNDTPEVRALYEGWEMQSFDYNPNGKGIGRAKERKELLICSEPLVRKHNQKITQWFQ